MLKNKANRKKKKSKLEKMALKMTMWKAFDNGSVKMKKDSFFMYHTKHTHQDQLLLSLEYSSIISAVKTLLRSQVFAQLGHF